MFREEKKESYEALEMEVVTFDEEDVITASGTDGDTPWGNL